MKGINSRKVFVWLFALCLWQSAEAPAALAEDGSGSNDNQKRSRASKMFKGLASWYGDKFHGRRTASGDTYDMDEYTCAHRTLPFGTQILVTNPATGKACTVTVNDRGPYHGKRVIDLSKAAAKKLGITGVGRVLCSTGKYVADKVTPDPKHPQIAQKYAALH